jgi:hypothetical protein
MNDTPSNDSPISSEAAPEPAPAPQPQQTYTPPPMSPRARMQQLLAIPDRNRTDAEWDELNELEIGLAVGNRIGGPEPQNRHPHQRQNQGPRPGGRPQQGQNRNPNAGHNNPNNPNNPNHLSNINNPNNPNHPNNANPGNGGNPSGGKKFHKRIGKRRPPQPPQ